MTEILWHGRGGQGAFTAAKLLGAAFSLSDEKYALAFPSFGPERRGAPILAFTKLDDKPIGDRSQIKKADYVVFLDETLFSDSAYKEVKEGGKILVNTKSQVSNGGKNVQLIPFDADRIALEILKMPVTNTVMLALLSGVSGIVSEEELSHAVEEYMPSKIASKNVVLVKEVFQKLRNDGLIGEEKNETLS